MNSAEMQRDPQLQSAALLAASGALRLTGEDVLRAIAYNSAAGVTITIAGRFQREDGQISAFKFALVPTSDRLVNTAHYQLGSGWLLNVQAYASAGAPKRGQCYVGLELSRGTDGAREPLGTLTKDYVAEGQGIAWPGSPIRQSIDGPGWVRMFAGTNPAAGAEVSETVPTGARWRILSMSAGLATDATVANRLPAIVYDDGTTTLFRANAAQNQTASQTVPYAFVPGYGPANNGLGYPHIPLPPETFLRAGWRVRTATGSLQAGDDWAAPALHVEEWIEP